MEKTISSMKFVTPFLRKTLLFYVMQNLFDNIVLCKALLSYVQK